MHNDVRADLLDLKPSEPSLVSVIIRTYNEEQQIVRVLDKIVQQEFQNVEIIIVDSGSKDNTLTLVDQYHAKVVEMPFTKYRPGYSINLGVEKACGQYIILCSGHAIPKDRYWVTNLIKHLGDESVMGVYGKQIPSPDCDPLQKRKDFERFGDYARVQMSDFFFSNVNSAFRRRTWELFPFDNELKSAEDWAWSKKVLSANASCKIIYEPSAIVEHSHQDSLRETYGRSYKKWISAIQIAGERQYSLSSMIATCGYNVLLDWFFIARNACAPKWYVLSPLYRFMFYLARYNASRHSKPDM